MYRGGNIMKVLFITHYADFYGANRSLLALMLHLRETYKIIPTVLINRRGDFQTQLVKHNIPYVEAMYYMCKIERNQIRKKIHVLLRKLITPFLFISAKIKLEKYGGFSLIHSNSSVINIGNYLAGKWDIPHIWHIREYGLEDYNLEDIYSRKFINKQLNCAFRVIAISNEIADTVSARYGNIPLEVIYNGVDIVSAYNKYSNYKNIVKFCIVGLICEGKNQIEVLKACRKLNDRDIRNYMVTFIGGFGSEDYKNEVMNFIEDNNMKENIEFTGYLEDINSLLKNQDVGIMASKKEAFGRVTIEYMSHYMPVIGADSGGTAELIREGENGYLYGAGDAKQLAEIMEKFINNTELIEQLGSNGRKFAEGMTAYNNAARIFSIYKNAVGWEE